MFGNNIIVTLKRIIKGDKLDYDQMQDFEDHLISAEEEYNSLSSKEKDNICVNLAKRMGCSSDDVFVCEQYIRSETFG